MKLRDRIRGYLSGAPKVSQSVEVRTILGDTLVGTVNTNGDGEFELQKDGSPGPYYFVTTDSVQTIRHSSRSMGLTGSTELGELHMILALFGNGVSAQQGNKLEVTSPVVGLKVQVKDGAAIAKGVVYAQYTALKDVTIPAAPPAQSRIDTVCVKIWLPGDAEEGRSELIVYSGTQAASPVAPTLPTITNVAIIPLADVLVETGVTTIALNKITDRRVFITIPIPDLSIVSGKIANQGLLNSAYASNSVDARVIAPDSVGASEILTGAVGTAEIAPLAVTEGLLATAVQTKLNAVGGSSTPAANSLTTAMHQDASITEPKLSSAVQTKLNAAGYSGGGQIIRMTPLSRDGASGRTGAVVSSTGVSIASGTLTIPSDGKTYDIIATGSIGTFNGTNIATSVAVQINGNLSAWQGGSGSTYRDIGLTHAYPNVTAGSYTVAIFMKVAGGSGEWDHYLLDAYAVPR